MIGLLQSIRAWFATHPRLRVPVILVAAMLIATLIYATRPDAEPAAWQEKAWPVSTMIAEPHSIAPTLLAYGRVESAQMARLKTSIGAPVGRVLVAEGDEVTAGDLLVQLDARELDLALDVARAELMRANSALASVRTDFELASRLTAHHRELHDLSEAKLTRHRDLYGNKMVSDEILDEVRRQYSERAITLESHLARVADFPNRIAEAEARVLEAGALHRRAELDVEQTRILAPFDGRVIERLVSEGDRLLPGVPVITVADSARLEVRANVPAGVRNRLSGNAGQTTAEGVIDGAPVPLRLARVSGDVKAGQSGVDVFFVPEAGDSLAIGRILSLRIQLPVEESVVAVPVQSLYENGRLYRVESDRLVALDVEQVGDHLDDDGTYRILVRGEALTGGDRLITTQLPRAITGLLVEPIDAAQLDAALAGEPGNSGDLAN